MTSDLARMVSAVSDVAKESDHTAGGILDTVTSVRAQVETLKQIIENC